MTSKKEAQQKYQKFQQLQQQIEEIDEAMEELNDRESDLSEAKGDIKELKEVEEETETFVSVAPGVSTKAKLQNTDEFLVEIGGKSAAMKNPDQVLGFLDRRIDDIKESREDLKKQKETIEEKSQEIMKELRQAGPQQLQQ